MASSISDEIKAFAAEYPHVILQEKPFERADLIGKQFVIAATDDPVVNRQVKALAAARVSCVIPEILVFPLTILIGILNILGGLLNLGKFVFQSLKGREKPRASLPPIVHILVLTQLVLSLLSIVFGTSMLISSLLPGLVIGIVLTANGVVLLYLLYILSVIDRMSKTMENTR